MIAIGFATQFYTLWDYHTEDQYYTDVKGQHHLGCVKHTYNYIKNISKDENKVSQLYPNIKPNHELFGRNSSWEKTTKIEAEVTQFPFGKLIGCDIATSNDVWQLTRLYEGGKQIGARRQVIARRRLLELGELVRYDWLDCIDSKYEEGDCNYNIIRCMANRKYATKKQAIELEIEKDESTRKAATVYHHQDGEKVEVELKRIESFGFETQYGYCYICKFISRDLKVYFYKGSTPPNINEHEYTKVKCTIKHNEYNGEKQTLIQRSKVISDD